MMNLNQMKYVLNIDIYMWLLYEQFIWIVFKQSPVSMSHSLTVSSCALDISTLELYILRETRIAPWPKSWRWSSIKGDWGKDFHILTMLSSAPVAIRSLWFKDSIVLIVVPQLSSVQLCALIVVRETLLTEFAKRICIRPQ
jgi:hypothetical protein